MANRQARGKEYQGTGGPMDKLAQRGGQNDYDVPGGSRGNPQIGNTDLPKEGILQEGIEASKHNVGKNPPGPGGQKYPGSDYYTPDPDKIAAQNEVPPESVVEAAAERR